MRELGEKRTHGQKAANAVLYIARCLCNCICVYFVACHINLMLLLCDILALSSSQSPSIASRNPLRSRWYLNPCSYAGIAVTPARTRLSWLLYAH